MTENQKKIYQMQQAGANPEQIAQAQGLMKQIDMKNDAASIVADNKKRIEDAMTPFQKFQAQIGKLDELFQNGMLDQNNYQLAQKNAYDDYDKAQNPENKNTFGTIDVANMTMGGVYQSLGTERDQTKVYGMDELIRLTKEMRDGVIGFNTGVN
jgi:hypothetical protein